MQRPDLSYILTGEDYGQIIDPETGLPWVPYTKTDAPEKPRVRQEIWIPPNPVPEIEEDDPDRGYIIEETGEQVF
jgi:hypothetical protein